MAIVPESYQFLSMLRCPAVDLNRPNTDLALVSDCLSEVEEHKRVTQHRVIWLMVAAKADLSLTDGRVGLSAASVLVPPVFDSSGHLCLQLAFAAAKCDLPLVKLCLACPAVDVNALVPQIGRGFSLGANNVQAAEQLKNAPRCSAMSAHIEHQHAYSPEIIRLLLEQAEAEQADSDGNCAMMYLVGSV